VALAASHGYDPEDLLHEAFVFFFQHDARALASLLEKQRQAPLREEEIERLLWDLACGLVANIRRARRRNPTESLDPARLSGDMPDPQRAALSRDLLGQLADCIHGQGARIFLYSRLRFVDGLKPEEISATTGWSMKATYKLKSALNEALAHCASRLGIHF
jgi:DNA-directed RNA polymerase specialized sigma24 family protein